MHSTVWMGGPGMACARWPVAKPGKALGSRPQSRGPDWEKASGGFPGILHKSSHSPCRCGGTSTSWGTEGLVLHLLTFIFLTSSHHVGSVEQTRAEPRPGDCQPMTPTREEACGNLCSLPGQGSFFSFFLAGMSTGEKVTSCGCILGNWHGFGSDTRLSVFLFCPLPCFLKQYPLPLFSFSFYCEVCII